VADFGIRDITNKQITPDDLQGSPNELLKKISDEKLEFVLSKRPVFNSRGEKVGTRELLLNSQESDGTLKFFNYSGAILDALN